MCIYVPCKPGSPGGPGGPTNCCWDLKVCIIVHISKKLDFKSNRMFYAFTYRFVYRFKHAVSLELKKKKKNSKRFQIVAIIF